MKNLTKKLSLLSTGLLLMAIALTFQKPVSSAFALTTVNTVDAEPTVTNLQISPDPYNPLIHDTVTINFDAKNTEGAHFNYVILDSTNEMLGAFTGRELKEGQNTVTWKPHPEIENGTYTVDVSVGKTPNHLKTYDKTFTVSRPGFLPLVITDVKFEPNPYDPSKGPAIFSFNVQNAQNRHYGAYIVDMKDNKLIRNWDNLSLHDGINTLNWSGDNTLKRGTYAFGIVAPAGSNWKNYWVEFTVIENNS